MAGLSHAQMQVVVIYGTIDKSNILTFPEARLSEFKNDDLPAWLFSFFVVVSNQVNFISKNAVAHLNMVHDSGCKSSRTSIMGYVGDEVAKVRKMIGWVVYTDGFDGNSISEYGVFTKDWWCLRRCNLRYPTLSIGGVSRTEW